jgi:hypothetical protein
MSAATVNSEQMQRTRLSIHDRLTDRSLDLLGKKAVRPDLFTVDGLTRGIFALEAIEAPASSSRRELRDASTHEIVPEMTSVGNDRGVVFYDPRVAWLYFVLVRRTARGRRPVAVRELPPRIPAPVVMPLEPVPEPPRALASAPAPQMFLTD